MKFIKFVMSKGNPITLPVDIAEKLIDSEGQMIKIAGSPGKWSGKTINKAHIISTDVDVDRERLEAENAKMLTPKIDETRDDENNREAVGKLKKDLFQKNIINK